MIIGHPRTTNKVEIRETLILNGSDIKRVKNQIIWSHCGRKP